MAEPSGTAAIVVAGGSGTRLSGEGVRKQFRPIGGVPMLLRALTPFLEVEPIRRVVVVLPEEEVLDPPSWIRQLPVTLVAGGRERPDSVRRGLEQLGDGFSSVIVHDGARPFVTVALINRVLEAVRECGVIPGLPIADTVKEVDESGHVIRTLDRDRLWRIQTPQGFPLTPLRRAHAAALRAGFPATDDAAVLEREGYPIRVIAGDPENIKVTTPADLAAAEDLARRLPER